MRDMKPHESGLYVHRASRTEALAEQLAVTLEATPVVDPLAAATVVVAQPALRRWLLAFLATRGSRGIAANLDTPLPGQWLERTLARVVPAAEEGADEYRAARLRWRIFQILPTLEALPIGDALTGEDAERRQFLLASRLAQVYVQYLVYRPDWITAWERGDAEDDWQARLWRRLRATLGTAHRVERLRELTVALGERGDGETQPLHVFGVSHLAPDLLRVLAVLAKHRPIHLYFPDPCREHWSYLASQRRLLLEPEAQARYFEIGHPLLAALGRFGQDFCRALEELDAQDCEVPEPEDDGVDNLLTRVQESVRALDPDRARVAARPADGAQALRAQRADASLRVHVCHTRLRELEVLKDALLAFLAEDDELTPRDIVVMAPDIAAYAPLLPAVFGEPARYTDDATVLPWHLADVALARSHPLIAAFRRLLDLALGRWPASEVLDWLATPAVARKFGIDAEARAILGRWLVRARVAWGLDASMKAALGGAALPANTWRFGLDRSYAGLLVGDEEPAPLIEGILPLPISGGAQAEAIGRLDRLLGALRGLRDDLAEARPLAAWSECLLRATETFFAVDPADADEEAAWHALQGVLAELAEQAPRDEQAPLGWSVVHEALREALETVPQQPPFLLGGITFCGLVAQRAIPFRVVCLLGMNEGEFPRVAADAALNRTLRQVRRGDRDVSSEDRYLFLESLMAARRKLHVSYLGEDAQSGRPRNPCAPLAELLQFLDLAHGVPNTAPDASRPWLIRHALPPFAARYYRSDRPGVDESQRGPDPALFTFDPTYRATVERKSEPPFVVPVAMALPTVEEWSLASLCRFYRDPARSFLRDGLGVSLDVLATDRPSDTEPLAARAERIERIAWRLFVESLGDREGEIPRQPPAWLAHSGILPGGPAGAVAYAAERDAACSARDKLLEHLALPLSRADVAVDLDLGYGLRLIGTVESVFRAADGRLWLVGAKLSKPAGFREFVPFYLMWAALRLTVPHVAACYIEKANTGSSSRTMRVPPILDVIVGQSEAQLRAGLGALARAAQRARREPWFYFPDAAFAYVTARKELAWRRARAAWYGFANHGERDRAPGYSALFTRGLDPFRPNSAEGAQFAAAAECIAALLDPDRRVLRPAPARGAGR